MYNTIMFRRLGLTLAASLLSLALFLFALFFSIHGALDNPTHIKNTLKQSGIYDIAATSTFDQHVDQATSGIPTADPAIQNAIKQAFPASLVQQSTDQFIDGMFGWIHGNTTQPQYSIDLTRAKQNLANNVAAYVQQHLSGLPVCTLDQMPTTIDIYAATCVPPNFDVSAAVNQARTEVASSDFLSNPVLTPANVQTDKGQTLTSSLQAVPKLYHDLLIALYALPVVIIGLGAAVIFLSVTRRVGFRRIGASLIGTGVTSIVVACFGTFALEKAVEAFTKQGGSASQPIQVKILRVVELLAQDLRTWWVVIGTTYLVAGIAALVVLRITRPKADKGKLLSPYESLARPANAGPGENHSTQEAADRDLHHNG
jgi:hypothetical protein